MKLAVGDLVVVCVDRVDDEGGVWGRLAETVGVSTVGVADKETQVYCAPAERRRHAVGPRAGDLTVGLVVGRDHNPRSGRDDVTVSLRRVPAEARAETLTRFHANRRFWGWLSDAPVVAPEAWVARVLAVYPDGIEAMRAYAADPEAWWEATGLDPAASAPVLEALQPHLQTLLRYEGRVRVQVTCFEAEGIEAIRGALEAAEAVASCQGPESTAGASAATTGASAATTGASAATTGASAVRVKARVVAAPVYELCIEAPTAAEGMAVEARALAALRAYSPQVDVQVLDG